VLAVENRVPVIRSTHCPRVILRALPHDGTPPQWLEFLDLDRVLVANRLEEVKPLLRDAVAAASQLHVAGFVTYEAAAAFDPALVTHGRGVLPLAWFGVFRSVRSRRHLPLAVDSPQPLMQWLPEVDLAAYRRAVADIHDAIEAGETYQANYTFMLRASFDQDSPSLFNRLIAAQSVAHAAYLDLGDDVICSASPELFFRLLGSSILCRPMKGTADRGLTPATDRRAALRLYDSAKNRAENLMIVDMVRNDLGRVARPGSVKVTSLFDLETYESVHQLTSTVEAKSDAPIDEIFAALFPCASITGAPKVRTMELLAGLEGGPRGIYTGAIGHIGPTRRAEFNVAIRTVHIDRRQRIASYGTGGGIVWDSSADEEYQECATKALILSLERPPFELLETLRWEPVSGFFLLDRHLDRLADSAEFFGFLFNHASVKNALLAALEPSVSAPQRVRLLLCRDGSVRVTHEDLAPASAVPWRLVVAENPIPKNDVFLYHKTTVRTIYDRAREASQGYDDTLLWNPSGHLTESTLANLVLRLENRLLTPPVEDGLLAGTFRAQLVASGQLSIASLDVDDLRRADEVWLINSVRRWIPVGCVHQPHAAGPRVVWRNLAVPGS